MPVRSSVVFVGLSIILGVLGGAFALSAPSVSLTSKGGNEWWVEAVVAGADAPLVTRVDAHDSYGAWTALTHEPWGTWGASFHIEPGHLVEFRATLADGRVASSCAFYHPSGAPACTLTVPLANGTAQPSPSSPPPPQPPASAPNQSATLDALSFARGGAMSGRVTLASAADITLAHVVLAARPPGGTNAGGPYLDIGSSSGVVLKAGVPLTLSFSRAVTSSDPLGSWYAFPTYQTADGAWHDGRSIAFNVTAGAPPPPPSPSPPPSNTSSFAHTNIVSTTFWVGEIADPSLPDGSQVCSAYDAQWAYHWSGVNKGTVPASASGCPGSILGGCDGIPGTNACSTERRTAANGYFPTSPLVTPKENPFYLDVPFSDINDPIAFGERCQVIPWAKDPGFAGHCTDSKFSYMKNHWVKIKGPNGNVCYGQIEDAGPSHGSLYHDAAYVFGTNDARPIQGNYNDAGMDVSPALNGCLGFAALNGDNDHVSWSFVNASDVPAGPWTKIVTTSPPMP